MKQQYTHSKGSGTGKYNGIKYYRKNKMYWHILGAGSIGLLWAAKLNQAGFRVTLILRNSHKLEVLRRESVIFCGNQRFRIEAEFTDSESKISNLLITTKAYDAEAAFESVLTRFSSDIKVLLFHNGLGPQQRLAEQYPQIDIWAGSTTDGAYLESGFHVVQAGVGETWIGSFSNPQRYSLYQQLKCLPALHHQSQIIYRLWQKLAINCAINPLTAIYDCKNGELLNNTEYLRQMKLICEEVEQVAAAQDIPLFEIPLIDKVIEVATVTATNYSSMQQDVTYQRQTEVKYINGYLCDKARQLGIATSLNDELLNQVNRLPMTRTH